MGVGPSRTATRSWKSPVNIQDNLLVACGYNAQTIIPTLNRSPRVTAPLRCYRAQHGLVMDALVSRRDNTYKAMRTHHREWADDDSFGWLRPWTPCRNGRAETVTWAIRVPGPCGVHRRRFLRLSSPWTSAQTVQPGVSVHPHIVTGETPTCYCAMIRSRQS
jgi:hypothetical protein